MDRRSLARWQKRLAGLTAYSCVRGWMATVDFQAVFADPSVNPASPGFEGPIIAVLWHESLLVPFYLYGHTQTVILTSQHRDGDWVSATAQFMGFQTVRGSTFRGAREALLQLLRLSPGRNVGIACDGPRGPRRQMAQGPIYLSARLGIPIVPYGVGFCRAWRLPTWDRFAVPLPFTGVRLVFGPRIQIPAQLGRDQLERYRQQVQGQMDQVTEQAEAWADTGRRVPGQHPLRRRPMPWHIRTQLRRAA